MGGWCRRVPRTHLPRLIAFLTFSIDLPSAPCCVCPGTFAAKKAGCAAMARAAARMRHAALGRAASNRQLTAATRQVTDEVALVTEQPRSLGSDPTPPPPPTATHPDRCCPRWMVCCADQKVGCCDPGWLKAMKGAASAPQRRPRKSDVSHPTARPQPEPTVCNAPQPMAHVHHTPVCCCPSCIGPHPPPRRRGHGSPPA